MAGDQLASVAQFPARMGEMGAQAALDAVNGEDVEPEHRHRHRDGHRGQRLRVRRLTRTAPTGRSPSPPPRGPPPPPDHQPVVLRTRNVMTRISALDVVDVRFPTSLDLDGSDAMNPEPDYSAAYVVLRTDDPRSTGCSLLFTTGRGNDVACAAVRALAPYVVGRDVAELVADVGALARDADVGRPAALARPREGRHAHGHRRGRERRMGPAGPARRATALAGPRFAARPRRSSRQIDFTYIDDALHARRTPSRMLEARRTGAPTRTVRARGRWAARLHDLGGLAGLRRRQGGAPRARSRSPRASPC